MSKLVHAGRFGILFLLMSFVVQVASAQTTQFTYQGRFTDSTVPQPTNGTYEMQFKAFDAAASGNQSGATVTLATVQVVNGIFTVSLDFGAAVFRGEDRFLEISVRASGSQSAFTTLAPRQQVTSAPFAIQSFNARNAAISFDSTNLGGLPASSYVQTGDSRLFDDRNPLGGSTNYVQNQNSIVQPSTDFNISGGGNADIFNAATQFNIGGNRILSVKGNDNFFGGIGSGANNNPAIASGNTFVGSFSGNANTAGIYNSFFGTDAGRNNQADANSFFGRSSGFANTSGASNSFFGLDSGRFNVAGSNNSFYGRLSGYNSLANNNSFFGFQSGVGTTTGGGNSFFGFNSGTSNTIGSNNTMLGSGANVASNNLNFATAIGAGATVSTSNTIVLGTAATGTEIPGTLKVFSLGAAGATTLCRNAANQIADCTGGGGGGAGNFIQNSTVLQPSADFNISGGGTLGGILSANIVNSTTNFRIGNAPVFSTPNQTSVVAGQLSNYILTAPNNAFFGYKAGQSANGFSQANTFIGSEAGETTTSGGNNSFVGRNAGFFNSSGSFNSFFGSGAGQSNTTANYNSFFGDESGLVNTTGTRNSFFGFQTGRANLTVDDNTFFGYQAGTTAIGGKNTFLGSLAGSANTGGVQNTFVGTLSGKTTTNGFSNSLLGFNTLTSGNENAVVGANSDANGNKNTVLGNDTSALGNGNTIIGNNALTIGFRTRATVIGADAQGSKDNTITLGTNTDTVEVPNLLTAQTITVSLKVNASTVDAGLGIFDAIKLNNTPFGDKPLCLKSTTKEIGVCPSSLSDKISSSSSGGGGGAATSLAEANNRQQTQIELQAAQIKLQQNQIEELKAIVCAINPAAAAAAQICGKPKPKEK